MDKTTARDYIRANFRDDDRLAIVLIQKSTGTATQRIANVDRITSDQFQAWLRYMNSQKHEVYVSMNALTADAHGRTKADVAAVRHVYLDFDKDGPEAVRALRAREDLPTPNHILQSSPGKFQVVWRVDGFEKDAAEALMRRMVRELGADPAATDSARVMRVPGFYNHKYVTPHFVSVDSLCERVYTPQQFPPAPEGARTVEPQLATAGVLRPSAASNNVTQSERDWAFALRALARGDEPSTVAEAMAAYRTDKPNPTYYAEYTVSKAAVVLAQPGKLEDPKQRCRAVGVAELLEGAGTAVLRARRSFAEQLIGDLN